MLKQSVILFILHFLPMKEVITILILLMRAQGKSESLAQTSVTPRDFNQTLQDARYFWIPWPLVI